MYENKQLELNSSKNVILFFNKKKNKNEKAIESKIVKDKNKNKTEKKNVDNKKKESKSGNKRIKKFCCLAL